MPSDGTPSTRAIAKVFFVVVGLSALVYVAWLVREPLLLVLIAGFLALALGPPVAFFDRRGVPRWLAILVVYLLIAVGVFGIGLLIVPPIVDQVDKLTTNLPGYIEDLRNSDTFARYDDEYGITDALNRQAEQLPSRLGDAAGALQSVTVGAFTAVIQLVTVLTMTFFLLLDGRRLVDFLLGLSGRHEPRLRLVAEDVYHSVSGYVAGNIIISLCAGLTTWITLEALGVPFAVPLAVLMAFLDLIPLVGATIGGLAIGLVTLVHDFPTATIVWVIVLLVYQQVENNVLQPVVYRQTVSVPPLATIVAILIGSALLGVLGALLAIPGAAVVQIVLRDIWRRRGHTPTLTHGDPLHPEPPPPVDEHPGATA
ncbi:MAG TPA: AI-2E family transporter [Capillimicrobium sp.]|nr:AI-2E family transporter [Capillimicrobium sp.]